MITTTNSKGFPRTCKKQELYTHLSALSENEVRTEVNIVISKHRNIDIETAKRKHRIRRNECKAVMIALGELEEGK